MAIMRQMSRDNVPFDIAFCTMNETEKKSAGLKTEKKVLLQTGYRRNQSKKNDILVSYLRADTGERRQFYLPLLMEFNGIKIKP